MHSHVKVMVFGGYILRSFFREKAAPSRRLMGFKGSVAFAVIKQVHRGKHQRAMCTTLCGTVWESCCIKTEDTGNNSFGNGRT